MDVFSEIGAVQSRIAEITGQPEPGAVDPAAFRSALAQAAGAGGAPGSSDTQPALAAAPVPPAQIDALVQQNATTWQVDPALVKAVIANESGFNANATSKVGARGLMQLMPATASSLGVRDAYDPAQNVAGGTRYLRGLLDRFNGDPKLAIAAYNAGPGAVEKYGGVPPYAETQNYVQNVLSSYDRYRAAP
ncbi:MAG: lytic transglycosylase domain-containing protein [Candidatus Velthaea sp.]|jgi:soluble lytic murein transglycosylase-like protein